MSTKDNRDQYQRRALVEEVVFALICLAVLGALQLGYWWLT